MITSGGMSIFLEKINERTAILFFCILLTEAVFCQKIKNENSKHDAHQVTLYSSAGIEYSEITAHKSSFLGDNSISVLKINPAFFDFKLICTSENHQLKTAVEWSKNLSLNIIFNAGMYNLKNKITHRFFLKNFKHMNNPHLSENINGVVAFNPTLSHFPKCQLFDLSLDNWEYINKSYHTIFQGLRMIDCNGQPVYWTNNNQFCSMLILAQDKTNNIYLIFSRSPYTQNQMIDNLMKLPYELINAIYLEGGTRANFVFINEDINVKKMGSYVSKYNPNDNNQKFYPFPNFVGLKALEK